LATLFSLAFELAICVIAHLSLATYSTCFIQVQIQDALSNSQFIITFSMETLVSHKCGGGQPIRGEIPFSAGFRERVDFGEIIGEYIKLDDAGKIVSTNPTSKVIVHYSNKGIHIVPSDPFARLK
jgi:hypothetical protein